MFRLNNKFQKSPQRKTENETAAIYEYRELPLLVYRLLR
jgi:hypothetical protein